MIAPVPVQLSVNHRTFVSATSVVWPQQVSPKITGGEDAEGEKLSEADSDGEMDADKLALGPDGETDEDSEAEIEAEGPEAEALADSEAEMLALGPLGETEALSLAEMLADGPDGETEADSLLEIEIEGDKLSEADKDAEA